jgi:hypothetical protein
MTTCASCIVKKPAAVQTFIPKLAVEALNKDILDRICILSFQLAISP